MRLEEFFYNFVVLFFFFNKIINMIFNSLNVSWLEFDLFIIVFIVYYVVIEEYFFGSNYSVNFGKMLNSLEKILFLIGFRVWVKVG